MVVVLPSALPLSCFLLISLKNFVLSAPTAGEARIMELSDYLSRDKRSSHFSVLQTPPQPLNKFVKNSPHLAWAISSLTQFGQGLHQELNRWLYHSSKYSSCSVANERANSWINMFAFPLRVNGTMLKTVTGDGFSQV